MKEIVYAGASEITLELPDPVEDDVLGFEAVFHLSDLDELYGDAPFRHVQMPCASYKPMQCWSASTVFVPYKAVRWMLCFPVEKQGRRYVPVTYVIPPDGDDVFYYFTGTTPDGTPVRAVPYLDGLKLLSLSAGSKLALIRASRWRWNKGRNVASIHPEDILEIETIRDSRVRVFS
jgi:hypothetical protein